MKEAEQGKWRHDARQSNNVLSRSNDVKLSVRAVSRLGPLRAPVTVALVENFHYSHFAASANIGQHWRAVYMRN
jgi:hypothetical protein